MADRRAHFWLKQIEKILYKKEYAFATNYLESVKAYINHHGKISDNQIEAIKSIKNKSKRETQLWKN